MDIIREALVSSRSTPIISMLTILMMAGMCIAVLLTSGRSAAAQDSVIASIDAAGTRLIVVEAKSDAHLTTNVLGDISTIGGVEWSGAFSAPQDVTNVVIPGSARVPMRTVWATDWEPLGINKGGGTLDGLLYASQGTRDALGMLGQYGAVSTGSATLAVAPANPPAQYLSFLEPILMSPRLPESSREISIVVIVSSRPDLVAPIAETVSSLVRSGNPSAVTVTTSEELANLRGLVQGQLGDFGRSLSLGILAVTGALTSLVMLGMALMRRKDFGRRRALGASRSLIIKLVVLQTLFMSVLGSALGISAALIILVATGSPRPTWQYVASIGVLSLLTALLSALAPALYAARREPIKELRVP